MSDALDPKANPLDSPDSPEDDEPDTIATPEGDDEGAPDAPLSPDEPVVERPRGDESAQKAKGRDWKSGWGLKIHGVNLIPGWKK